MPLALLFKPKTHFIKYWAKEFSMFLVTKNAAFNIDHSMFVVDGSWNEGYDLSSDLITLLELQDEVCVVGSVSFIVEDTDRWKTYVGPLVKDFINNVMLFMNTNTSGWSYDQKFVYLDGCVSNLYRIASSDGSQSVAVSIAWRQLCDLYITDLS